MPKPSSSSHQPRASGCINRSKELERRRIERLSIEDRIRLALGLKERIAEILPQTRPKP